MLEDFDIDISKLSEYEKQSLALQAFIADEITKIRFLLKNNIRKKEKEIAQNNECQKCVSNDLASPCPFCGMKLCETCLYDHEQQCVRIYYTNRNQKI
jgi:hypothetical protein